MSKGQMLRALVKQRLSLAAEEIFDLFERTIAEYEEQLCRSKEENERQRKLLDAVFKPQLRLHRADVQQLMTSKEEIPSEQQDWSSSLDQENPPELPHIKEEQEELLTNQEEAGATKLTFSPVPVKSEDDDEEKPQSSLLHERQTEADGEDCGGPEPAMNSDPDGHLQPETEDKPMDSSDTEVSDGDWEETREPQSDLISQINNEGSAGVGCSPGQEPFVCSECGAFFVRIENFIKHTRIHTGEKPFSCLFCGQRFKQKVHLTYHMTRHTGEKRFSCTVCGRRFTWPYQLKKHKCVGHQSSNSSTEQIKSETDAEDCGGPEPARKQPDMHLQSEPEDSDGHWNETKDAQSSLNSLENSEVPISDVQCSTNKKPFTSSDCGETSSKESKLNTHMSHTGEKPFSCHACDKTFSHQLYLVRHMIIHTGEKPFSCSFCDKRFARKENLTQHMASHAGQKPFHCSECGKRFLRKGNLIEHMSKHTGEKRFSCSVCSKRFTRKVHMKAHMALHTEEKPFSCSECDRRFLRKGDLARHMDIHSGEKPFTCSQCGKRFLRKFSLELHMACHSKEKPFSCSVCDKGFSRKQSLHIHMRTHTGDKPYCCPVCNKSFIQKVQLTLHVARHIEVKSVTKKEPHDSSLTKPTETETDGEDC